MTGFDGLESKNPLESWIFTHWNSVIQDRHPWIPSRHCCTKCRHFVGSRKKQSNVRRWPEETMSMGRVPWLGRSEVMNHLPEAVAICKCKGSRVIKRSLDVLWRFNMFLSILITSASVRKLCDQFVNSSKAFWSWPGRSWIYQRVATRVVQERCSTRVACGVFGRDMSGGQAFWRSCFLSLAFVLITTVHTCTHTHCWERWVLLNDVGRQP